MDYNQKKIIFQIAIILNKIYFCTIAPELNALCSFPHNIIHETLNHLPLVNCPQQG